VDPGCLSRIWIVHPGSGFFYPGSATLLLLYTVASCFIDLVIIYEV
jgi:hypothetical protein